MPVSYSSLVTINGHLLAVGGEDSNRDKTKDIYQYNMTSWTVISQMSTPRSSCLTAALPGNKLMVVGGDDTYRKCEIVTFVLCIFFSVHGVYEWVLSAFAQEKKTARY